MAEARKHTPDAVVHVRRRSCVETQFIRMNEKDDIRMPTMERMFEADPEFLKWVLNKALRVTVFQRLVLGWPWKRLPEYGDDGEEDDDGYVVKKRQRTGQ